MFTPREVQTFIKMLDVLADPKKAKAMCVELEQRANEVSDKLAALEGRESELRKREERCAMIEKHEAERNAVLEHKRQELQKVQDDVLAQAMELQTALAKVDEREKELDRLAQRLKAQENDLNRRDSALITSENKVEQLRKALERQIEEYQSKIAKLRETIG